MYIKLGFLELKKAENHCLCLYLCVCVFKTYGNLLSPEVCIALIIFFILCNVPWSVSRDWNTTKKIIYTWHWKKVNVEKINLSCLWCPGAIYDSHKNKLCCSPEFDFEPCLAYISFYITLSVHACMWVLCFQLRVQFSHGTRVRWMSESALASNAISSSLALSWVSPADVTELTVWVRLSVEQTDIPAWEMMMKLHINRRATNSLTT